MSLQSRLEAFIAVVGSDVKALKAANHIDAGTVAPDPANPNNLKLYIYTNQTDNSITVYRWV